MHFVQQQQLDGVFFLQFTGELKQIRFAHGIDRHIK